MNTNLQCSWPKAYWHVTRELMNDNKRFTEKSRTREIINLLKDQLNENKTNTMTFTDDGLELAIKIIKETYGIAN